MLVALLACTVGAPSEPVAPPVIVQEAPPPGAKCPQTAAELPASPRLDPTDERLRFDDLVVVLKSRRVAGRYDAGALKACWPVALGMHGGGDAGPKEREGDVRTPEGWYRTSDRPASRYYHAIFLHYPNLADADRGLAAGLIDGATHGAIADALHQGEAPPQTTALGSYLLLHGGGSGSDWTLGCVAFEDADIDALRAELPNGMRAWALILP